MRVPAELMLEVTTFIASLSLRMESLDYKRALPGHILMCLLVHQNELLKQIFAPTGRADEPADGRAADHRHPHQRRPGRKQLLRQRRRRLGKCQHLHVGQRRGATEDQRQSHEGPQSAQAFHKVVL